ncbi:MAG: protein-L-isoaspartate(D-aspartate) O-methyltransferase [Deltaproteobacteria bacterium]
MNHNAKIARLIDEIKEEYRFTAGFTGRMRPDSRVVDAMIQVPRHEFVPDHEKYLAYENYPLPIGHGQTISQPYIVALMTDLLDLEENDKVLEVGTGCGYQSAIISLLVREVYTIEIVEPLALEAQRRLRDLGYSNVSVRHGDGYHGWPEQSPFNGIIVTATASIVPPPLVAQLANNGKLILPLGRSGGPQELTLISKDSKGRVRQDFVLDVAFVPLTGDHGVRG